MLLIGLGIDMSDEELKTVADELNLTDAFVYFDQFVQFMVTFLLVPSSLLSLSSPPRLLPSSLLRYLRFRRFLVRKFAILSRRYWLRLSLWLVER